jgi:hypothetical protein
MTGRLYTGDSWVVRRLREYFERQYAALSHGQAPSPELGERLLPSVEQLARLLEAAFWASLRNEEGRGVTLSLAFMGPSDGGHSFRFAVPLALVADRLAKISPAVERPGIHLGVAEGALGGLEVWGYTRRVPLSAIVLEAAGPGLIVVKHRRNAGRGKFANVALLAGDEARFIREKGETTIELADVFEELLAERRLAGEQGEIVAEILARLALSMRAHKRGGTLLLVPTATDSWLDSLAAPLAYRAAPRYAELHAAVFDEVFDEVTRDGEPRRARKITRVVDVVGGLTAVDGATVVTDRLEVVGFGAKIRRRGGATPVSSVLLSEPVEDGYPSAAPIWALGGTRHQSAAQFVQDQPETLALVSSQEGRFTTFAWSDEHASVVAHRVDALLY